MLRPERAIERVYLHRAPIDMRKQMDGLAALVEGALRAGPFLGRCSCSSTAGAPQGAHMTIAGLNAQTQATTGAEGQPLRVTGD